MKGPGRAVECAADPDLAELVDRASDTNADATLAIGSADTAWVAWRPAWLDVPAEGHERPVPRDAALHVYAPGYLSETRQAVAPNGVARTRLDFHLRPIEGLFEPTDR